jgi:hypothetical protein
MELLKHVTELKKKCLHHTFGSSRYIVFSMYLDIVYI